MGFSGLLLGPADDEQVIRAREAFVHLVSQPEPERRAKAPVPVLFDTDMGNDIDDALALTLLHGLQARGECELLAVTSSKHHPASTAFIDAVNRAYGCVDMPLGRVSGGATKEPGAYLLQTLQRRRPDGHGPRYPHLSPEAELADAVPVLRRALAGQADGPVVMLVAGFSTNVAALLDSPADDLSPLSGMELVARKVKVLAMMAGSFDCEPRRPGRAGEEHNVKNDIPAAQRVVHDWPTPIVMNSWWVGHRVTYPGDSIDRDFDAETLPVPFSWRSDRKRPGDHPAFDLTSVLQVLRPEHGYFDLTPPGRITVDAQGITSFAEDPNGRHTVLEVTKEQEVRAREALAFLSSEPVGPLRHLPRD